MHYNYFFYTGHFFLQCMQLVWQLQLGELNLCERERERKRRWEGGDINYIYIKKSVATIELSSARDSHLFIHSFMWLYFLWPNSLLHIPAHSNPTQIRTITWNTLKSNEWEVLSQQQYRSLETCLFDRANPCRVRVVIFLSVSNANAAP